jgi:hypothetical protein
MIFHNKVTSFTNNTDEGVSSLLEPLAEQPWPEDALPESIRHLPGEIQGKYGLPKEFSGCLLLSMAAAHIGSSVRLGEKGEHGRPLNLNFAISLPDSWNLAPIFRTLGSRLFNAEAEALTAFNTRRGKRATVAEVETADFNAKELRKKKKKTLDEMDEAYGALAKLQRLERPHLIFDEGSPEYLGRLLESSMDNGLYALSDQGGPLPQYLQEFTPRQKGYFLSLARKASDMLPIKNGAGGNSHWHYAGQSLLNTFWATGYEFLAAALRDEMMIQSGFWHNFFLLDCREMPQVEHTRIGYRLPTLDKWEQVTKQLLLLRNRNTSNLVSATAEADALFADFSEELKDLSATLPLTFRNPIRKWVTLAQKLAGIVLLLEMKQVKKIEAEQAAAGIALCRWLGAQTLQMQQAAATSRLTIENLEAEKIMLEKLEKKGPMDFRSLIRSYRKQAKSLHLPVLESLQRKGVIKVGDDELIRLVG